MQHFIVERSCINHHLFSIEGEREAIEAPGSRAVQVFAINIVVRAVTGAQVFAINIVVRAVTGAFEAHTVRETGPYSPGEHSVDTTQSSASHLDL